MKFSSAAPWLDERRWQICKKQQVLQMLVRLLVSRILRQEMAKQQGWQRRLEQSGGIGRVGGA
jgi:hypothetical protein